ncbi:MAG TPA: response regulator [Gemmatimonadales bacterium]|nr:response regulator [Gemmatimonadales bacterium]
MTDAAEREERLRLDLRRLLQERLLHESGIVLFGHPALILLVVVLIWQQLPHIEALSWALAVMVATLFRSIWLRTVAERSLSEHDIRQGVRLTVATLGIAWGVGAAIAFQDLPFADIALVLVVLAGISAGGLTTLSADMPSYFALVGSITGPLFAGILIAGHGRQSVVTAVMIALFAGVLVVVARRAHGAILEQLRATVLLASSEEGAKRAEKEMRVARDLARRAAQSRSAFLANMSHEIRTPMNAVLGFVELILDTDLSPEQRRGLELVRSSSEALLTILNDILDYSKIEAEHLQLEAIPFDLSKVVHATASLLAVRAREKHLELLTEVPHDVPPAVRGDPTRLRQVLTNLIGNAIKFTEEGEVVVTVTALGMERGAVRVRFSVRDTGIGITGEQLRTIFQEFTQADASMTRRYGGTGLGLSISQRLVRLMGGELQAKSELGRGSEFTFTIALPLEDAVPAISGTRTSLGGRRALIVDDNETNRRILRDMLAAEGMAVDEASSAAAATQAMTETHRQGADYDLAILDVQMPGEDGFALAGRIRADPALARTRLLMLTSAGNRGDGERCRQLGISGYLTKPVSRSDLAETIAVVLAAPADTTAPELVTRHTIAESRQSLRVLLAEDNKVNQQVAVAMLVKRGHQVEVVGDGRAAVDAVRRRRYDAVLMDIQMPEMDGFEATHAIRALPDGGAIPIIALTAHALSGERERCLAQGMSGYLAKPFKGHELYAVVEGPAERPAAPLPASAPSGAPVDLEGFRRIMRESGAETAVDVVLETFSEEAPKRLRALELAVAARDAVEVNRVAHAFRGSAATIGAHDLAAMLQEVETAAHTGDTALVRARFPAVKDQAEAVFSYIKHH